MPSGSQRPSQLGDALHKCRHIALFPPRLFERIRIIERDVDDYHIERAHDLDTRDDVVIPRISIISLIFKEIAESRVITSENSSPKVALFTGRITNAEVGGRFEQLLLFRIRTSIFAKHICQVSSTQRNGRDELWHL